MERKIGSLKVVPEEKLKHLNTKRLIYYKKSVLAQRSALYERNKAVLDMSHPFNALRNVYRDYDDGQWHLGKQVEETLKDKQDYDYLVYYHTKIKEILATRENVE